MKYNPRKEVFTMSGVERIFFSAWFTYKINSVTVYYFQNSFSTLGQTYSTCTIDPKTCPDEHCDKLEQLDPYGLCPQDCMPPGN